MDIHAFRLGDLVKIVSGCPIDHEGVGPLPGDVGRVVSIPEPGDVLRYLGVRFDRLSSFWMIPRRYLEHT